MAVRLIRALGMRRLDIWSRHRKLLVVVDASLLSTARIMRVLDACISTLWDELLIIITTSASTLALLILGSAAADGEHPEQTAADAEGNGEPGGGQEGGVESRLHAVCLGGGLDGCYGGGTEGCGHDAGGDDRDCAEAANNVGDA